MAKRTEIDVIIDGEGNVRFDVKGVKGKGCLEYEELFRQVLGQVTERELTSGYYESEGHICAGIEGKRRD